MHYTPDLKEPPAKAISARGKTDRTQQSGAETQVRVARPSTATGDQFVDKSLKEAQGCLGKVRGRSWEPQALQGSGLASEGALVTGAIVLETSEPLSIPEVTWVTDTRPTVPLPTVVSLCKVFPESWGSEILFYFSIFMYICVWCAYIRA